MRMIDGNDAEMFAREHILDAKERYLILDFLRECSTVDAVSVVRCKDCKRCDGFPEPDDIQPNEIGICKINMMAVKPDAFCSYGERKDGDDQ